MRRVIVGYAIVSMLAAIYTGARADFHFFTSMTGFFPPHYGYSTYVISVLPLLAPGAVRWISLATLLASGNRASWVGVIAGWAFAGGRRRAALAVILGFAAVVGGLLMKGEHQRANNDPVRRQIWEAALSMAAKHPEGVGPGGFCIGVEGREVTKAHSDVLQLLVERGVLVFALVMLTLGWAFYRLPEGPYKAVVVALSAQSVIDNRLHHPACAVLYVAVWLVAAREHQLAILIGERGAGVAKLVEPHPEG